MSVAAGHSLNIKERYENLRFCHGFLASFAADHNALRCGRASFSADHNALRLEEPRFHWTRMHWALPQFETKTTTNCSYTVILLFRFSTLVQVSATA